MKERGRNEDRMRKTAGGRRHLMAIAGARQVHALRAKFQKPAIPDIPSVRATINRSLLKTTIIAELRRARRRIRQILGDNYF